MAYQLTHMATPTARLAQGGYTVRAARPLRVGQTIDLPAAVAVASMGSRREALERRAVAQPARLATWVAGAFVTLLVWSFSYICRQPGLDATAAFSPLGDFAIEGMVLALAWLGMVAGGCVALATGAIVLRDPQRDYGRASR